MPSPDPQIMPQSPQTYANHRRYFPLFHYVALPILLANVVVTVAHAIRQPSAFNAWLVVLALGLVSGLIAMRASALIVQNRLIALEVRLRLASSLAQAGYKTLLVDFDLRNPSMHAFAGMLNGTGVCDLLRGEADVRKSIQVLPNGLNFLPAGKWSDEARQAATGGRLESLMARLKEPYDCVVLHGHALLTVAETVEVARRSEVVLLCALYRETKLPLVKRAAERIATMEIPYSGIVYLGATTQEALC